MTSERKRILIVEDDPALVKTVRFRLTQEGYEVYEASDGVQMLNELKKLTPDLIILDIMLPYIDGYSALKELRRIERFSKLPVIILSAKEKEKMKDLFIFEEVFSFIEKPFEMEVLLKNIRAALEG